MVTEFKLVSPEEYLARERPAEYKSEYVNGHLLALAGSNLEHNLIAGNVPDVGTLFENR